MKKSDFTDDKKDDGFTMSSKAAQKIHECSRRLSRTTYYKASPPLPASSPMPLILLTQNMQHYPRTHRNTGLLPGRTRSHLLSHHHHQYLPTLLPTPKVQS
jgi:hypothetical protein